MFEYFEGGLEVGVEFECGDCGVVIFVFGVECE